VLLLPAVFTVSGLCFFLLIMSIIMLSNSSMNKVDYYNIT